MTNSQENPQKSPKCCKNYNITPQTSQKINQNSPEIIFFGNGPLADATLSVLKQRFPILFHARTKEDLEQVKALKLEHKNAFGILASFGVMIKSDVLDLFEPEGIINIHPSLLPDLRGSSPIESAILRGDTSFSVSVMKLVRAMDAGPLFHQKTIEIENPTRPDLKSYLYSTLATAGATWLIDNLENLRNPDILANLTPQDEQKATFCGKFDKSLSPLTPATKSADVLHREILAFQGFPRSKITLFGRSCVILEAHTSNLPPMALSENKPLIELPIISNSTNIPENAPAKLLHNTRELALLCADGAYLYLDRLQPDGKRPMDAHSFLNGYFGF